MSDDAKTLTAENAEAKSRISGKKAEYIAPSLIPLDVNFATQNNPSGANDGVGSSVGS